MGKTVDLDDDLVLTAKELTGIADERALIAEGTRALIEREAARKLIVLGGTMPSLAEIPRRRSSQ